MPSWSEIVSDVNQYSNAGNELDKKREEYLNKIRSITGRNVIAYYSGWLRHYKIFCVNGKYGIQV